MSAIVMATDGSPSAQKATEKAIELAKATGWRLHFVTSWSLSVGYGYAPMTHVPYTGDLEREHGRDALDAAVASARAAGVEATSELRCGTPVEEICAAAERIGAEVIVIGAHGRDAVRRFVFGSVSTGVMHHASCPVLVVRGGAAPTEDAESEKALEVVLR